MSTLVIAEHDNSSLKVATSTRWLRPRSWVRVLISVAGADCGGAAEQAAKVPGVGKVLVADNAAYAHQLAENVSLLIAEVAAAYDNIVAPATSNCKTRCRVSPRCLMSRRSLKSPQWSRPTLSSDRFMPVTSSPR